MKLALPEKSVAERIWEDPYLSKIEEQGTREAVYMEAAYFDTEEGDLGRSDITFRVRKEGAKVIATLKWNGRAAADGMHMREEINVPVDDPICFIQPNPELFRESEAGQRLLKVLNGKEVHSILEIHFLRTRERVDTGKSICELSVDVGEILTDYGTEPICELEIELFSGDPEDVKEMGSYLANTYGLVPEDRSKYARGFALIQKNRDRA